MTLSSPSALRVVFPRYRAGSIDLYKGRTTFSVVITEDTRAGGCRFNPATVEFIDSRVSWYLSMRSRVSSIIDHPGHLLPAGCSVRHESDTYNVVSTCASAPQGLQILEA